MKINAILLLVLSLAIVRAEDITTPTKVYHNVTITKVDPDGVHAVYDGGCGKIPFKYLSPELQKKYGYDPKKAQDFAAEQAKRDAASDAARIQAEAEAKAANPPQVTAGITAAPPAPPSPQNKEGLSPEARASIQNQINDLQQDIAFMKAQEAKLDDNGKRLKKDGGVVTHGGYPQKIADDQAQVDQLKTQLAGN